MEIEINFQHLILIAYDHSCLIRLYFHLRLICR